MDDHKKALMRAYQDASAILRKKYDSEFHMILADLYDQRGITVRKRRSRLQKAKDQLAAAQKVLDSSDVD
jgi:hypothetical protein